MLVARLEYCLLLAYLLVIGVLSLLGWMVINHWDWLSCLLFLRNYLSPAGFGSWYTGHFWSLSIEEHFYLLLPGLLVLVRSKRALPVVIALAMSLAAWRFIEFRQHWLTRLLPGVGFYTRSDIRLDSLLWGSGLALLWAHPGWRDRLTLWLSPLVWTALVLLFIACVYVQPPFAMLWQAILIPLLLVGTVLRPSHKVSRFLETKPMRWVGRISYSLYLWQQLFLVPSTEPRPLHLLQYLPLNIVAVFVCSILSYYLLERPMIGLGHRVTYHGSEQTLVAESAIRSQNELTSVLT
jgi:peptidoglycan/LPS O-acetylase OafA/YrhL